MIKKNQHVVPVGTKWGVKGEGNSRYTKVTDTQREAMVVALRLHGICNQS